MAEGAALGGWNMTPASAPWRREKAEDRGREWTDWLSADGTWKAAEGHDEPARADRRPWTLFRVNERGQFRSVRAVASLAAAKALAIEIERSERSPADDHATKGP